MGGICCGKLLGLLAVLASIFTTGECSTDDFLKSLQHSGLSYWSVLLNETGLAQVYAKDHMTRYGIFLVPSDSALSNAYEQSLQGGASNLQWLNWARKVITYHYLNGRLGYDDSKRKFVSKTWYPIYPSYSFLRVEVHRADGRGYLMRAVADSGEYTDFYEESLKAYNGMVFYAIDKVLLPKGIESPDQIANTETPDPLEFPVYNNTGDFLNFLKDRGHSKFAELVEETQLADTFAQNDMSRYGMLFAPSDTGIGDAYAKAVDSGLSYSEWLEWASKVIPYHFVDSQPVECAEGCSEMFFPLSPPGSFLQYKYVEHFTISASYHELTTDADPSQSVKFEWNWQGYQGMKIFTIGAVLVPMEYPIPGGSSLEEYYPSNSTAALSSEPEML